MNKNNFTKVLCSITFVIGAYYIVAFFFFSIPRLLYPFEIEWMEGSILDHAVRIVEGKQLYVAPTIEFVNWLYQPLFYYVSAALMKVIGIGYAAGRVVSFTSTLVSAALIFSIAKKISGEKFFTPYIALSLFFASYGMTGFIFDIARIDALLCMLLLISTALLLSRTTIFSAISAAFFFALAFFTKQQAIYYFLPFGIWLFLKDRKIFVSFLGSGAFFILIGIAYLVLQNGEWYQYYVMKVPQAKSRFFVWRAMLNAFPYYVFGLWAAGSFVIMMFFSVTLQEGIKKVIVGKKGLLLLIYLTTIVQLTLHLGDKLSYKNITLPFVCFSSIMLPIALREIRLHFSGRISDALLFVLPVQFISLFYNPLREPMLVITQKNYEGGNEFIAKLRQIPGDVFIPIHGMMPRYAGKITFANELATDDVLTVNDQYAVALRMQRQEAFKSRRFSAIILDKSILPQYDSVAGYSYSSKITISPYPFITRMGDQMTIPMYIYVPKSVGEDQILDSNTTLH